jgi:hypothetical protein
MRLPVTAAVLFAFATLQASFVHAATPITHVAIYRGPAGCDDCSESVKSALQRLSPNYQIDFVGADEPIDITPHTLARYDLYVQPGGGQDLDSEAGRPGFEVAGIEDAAVRVVWEGKPDRVFYQDGPYFPKAHGASPYTTIATYRNGDVAAARYTYEKGVVVLSGPHPEAGQKWFEDAGIALSERPRGELFGALMRRVGQE